ncbi:TLR4 interactor with leucine rich repeats [Geodia barretti]|uniref:TLR4 interactor with leucine rich repeats n=1 Tax=Geodia barretti TaxID=519541 RepID=A0AA35R652_GEOBA|nr:TLR4 interactor with leucine rich repeats [Geodia barretti]
MMACGGVRLCCLLLTLVTKALSCGGGDLVDCAQTSTQDCLCLRVTSTSGDSVVPTRTCTSSPVEIDYGNNAVREVEAGVFRYFPQLISLNLSSNSPPELVLNSQSFLGLDSLTSLDLRSDGLSDLPDCLFTPLPSLETLYLQSNNLSQLNVDAFGENMANLTTLYLDHNRLTELPPDLLDHLPALTSISLSSNVWDCSSPNVAVLVNLVHSGLVWNGDQLRCDNSTLVSDISIPDEPSPTPSPTPSVTPTPLPTTPTVHHTPTPTPQLPRVCSRLENSGSEFGFFDWPETAAGERVERACPHGPEGGVASRECGEMGEWGAVEGGGCAAVSQTTLELVAISQSDITVANVESVSSSLSAALSPPSPSLSTDEVEVVLDVLETLIFFPMASLNVLNNSLQAVDHLLSSSGDSLLTAGSSVANRLRDVIDSALLSFLSANDTRLVLTFSHLALGGVYLTGTNHTHIVAVIATGDDGDGRLVIGEEGGGGDVEVVIDGDLEGPIQVTVYNDADIFNTTTCGENEGLEGDNDLAPVISVSDEPTTGSESVTITYNTVGKRNSVLVE